MVWPVAVDAALRDELLGRLDRPRPRAQIVRGAPGIGKTTLAAAVAAGLTARGVRVLPILGLHELSTVPLAAMAPTLGALGAPLADSISERVQQLFARVAADAGRYALLVDDGPLLDPTSASAIYQLVRATGVRCVITARSGSRLPGPLQRLADEGLVETSALHELDPVTAGTLVEQALGGVVEPDSLRRLVVTADGNPLFLRELVAAANEGGAVSRVERGITIDQTVLPDRVVDGIAARLDRLEDGARRTAELIAVAGRWTDGGVGSDDRITLLIDQELVRRDRDGSLYLVHPIVGEVIVARMSADALAARRIEAADRLDGEDGDATRFRIDVLRAGTAATPAPEELTWAAGYAHALVDHRLAVELADRALASGAGFEAVLLRAMALSALKSPDAEEAFGRARSAASGDLQIARAACERARHEAIARQRPGAALEHERSALLTVADPAARELLQDDIARWSLVVGEEHPAPRSTRREETAATLGALAYEVMFAAQTSDFARAREALDAAGRMAAGSPAAAPVLRMLDLYRFRVLVYEEGLFAGGAFAEERRADILGDEVGMWSNALAVTALHMGRVDQAGALAQVAVEQLRWRDVSGVLSAAEALVATIAAARGEHEAAERHLATASSGDIKEQLQRSETAAWLSWHRGDAHGAVTPLVAAGRHAIEANAAAVAAPTVYLAVRMGGADRALPLLAGIAASTESAFIGAILAHAESAVARDGAALLRSASRLADVGLLAGAVDAAGTAARRLRASGRLEEERRAGLLAARWSLEIGDYRGLGVERTPFDLSAREWEIARAAAGRERSREIAARLGLSTRTVDNHLARIYRKLGIAGRDRLREALDTVDGD